MKKIVSSLFFLISIFLFQQILFSANTNETILIANLQTKKTSKRQKEANKEIFHYYVNIKDYDKLIPVAKNLLNFKLSKREKYDVFFNLSKAYLNINKLEDAVTYALEAEYLYPKKEEVKLMLGAIYKNNNLYELAITKYKSCLDLNKNNIEALINLGYVYNFQENYKKSLDCFQKADYFLKKDKKYLSKEDYICMAISAKEIGLINKAQNILENIEIKDKRVSLLLSKIYYIKQDFKKAQKELIPFVYKEYTDIEVYCDLAKLYILSKKFNQAKDLLLYFKSKNHDKNFEAIDFLLAENFYSMYSEYGQKSFTKLNQILNCANLKSIRSMIEKNNNY